MAGGDRVLMVAGTSIVAGGERNLLDLTAYAMQRGFEVGLAAPGEGELPRRMRSLGCPVWSVAMPKLPNPLSVLEIRKVLEAEGFDILHAHGHLAALYARPAALGLRKVKTVYTLHGVHYPHYRNALKRTAFIAGERMLKHCTDRFICVCRSDLETARELGIVDPGRSTVIYNGIDPAGGADPSEAARLRKKYGRGEGIVLHVGRFRAEKDHRTLISSIPLVLEEHPRSVFLLAGSGRLLAEEREFAAGLGISGESLVFLGESSEVDELLAACDVLALPSLWEGFSYVILEAMRAAKPVVATRTGGTPEAVSDGETGLLVNPRDPQGLSAAICRLLSHPEEAAAMGTRGKEKLGGFTLESMARATLGLYNDLLQHGGHGTRP